MADTWPPTVRDLDVAKHHGARAIVHLPSGRELVGRLSWQQDAASFRPRKEWHVIRRGHLPYSLAFNQSALVVLLPPEEDGPTVAPTRPIRRP